MNDPQTQSAPRRATPAIDALLSRVRGRLLREVWVFGLGRALFMLSLWVLFSFLVDWVLHVPLPVRLLHLAVLIGLPAFMLWRDLYLRLRAIPERAGLAVLVERAQPQLHELLVSAVQLHEGQAAPDGSQIDQALVQKVIAEADSLAASLDLRQLTDPRPPRASMALGLVAALATLATLGLQPEAASIFLERLFGASTPWPQKTHLALEIPLARETYKTRGELEISVARGSDLPIVVRSEGRVPDDVTLTFDGGHQTLLGSAGRGVFRTLLRSVQEDLAFYVTGGDDTDGTPSLRVIVLQPPDVSRIAVHVIPPAYSGLAERTVFDRDVSVLVNSRVTISMLPDPADAAGVVRLLPQDHTLELRSASFPVAAETSQDSQPEQAGLAFDLVADESLRYRFEIQDSTGLSNPDPGLFALNVEPDRPPNVSLLAPARGEVESVIGAALPLKALASDDFGLGAISWRAFSAALEGADVAFQELESRTPSDPSVLTPNKDSREKAYVARRLEINDIFGSAAPSVGEVFQIEVAVSDNREPAAQDSVSSAVRLRIVSADEFLRHIQDRLARVRAKVESLSSLMGEKQSYTLDLIASLESDEPGRVDASSIQAALGAARRVEGDAQALTRELAAIAETLLWSRIDDRAAELLAALELHSLPLADRNFHPEPWLALVDLQKQQRLGDGGLAYKLVEVVGIALEISEADSPGAVAGLRRSLDLLDMTAQYDSLIEVSQLQSGARAKAEQMLALLSEWDSYQSVLSAVRDLLSRQKSQLDRTRQFYKDN